MEIEQASIDRLNKYLHHLVVQGAHNAARLNAIMNGVAHLVAKLEETDYREEAENLRRLMNDEIPFFLGEALNDINDVPDIN